MMKLLLVVFSVVLAVSAEDLPIWKDYHEEVGIGEATRIRLAEQAADFDGSRIVGGSVSSLGQHPFLGGLIITLTTGAQSVCGCSLLTNNRCLTAAHCWRHGNSQGRQITVVLGSTRIFSGGTRINTNNVQMHASYNQNNLNNDIAMLVISWVNFSNTINRINRATGTNAFVGTWATAAGFGRQADNQGIGSNQALMHVSMQVITNQACANVYGSSVVIASVICTATTGGRGICQGDSGGPLFTGSGTGATQIGISSFVHRDGCQRGQPAGFARMTSFAAWIQQRL